MKNDKLIQINGEKVPVGRVKHWRYTPETIGGTGACMWPALEVLKNGWNNLDASEVLRLLSDNFTYGSYWVNGSLDRAGYEKYLYEKFQTIKARGPLPNVDIVVLYEGIVAGQFPYALRLRQGDVTTLLTIGFGKDGISSLYMTDPDIFTYEPTFEKGGIKSRNGEPMCFRHECAQGDVGRLMSEAELQEFIVTKVADLFAEANAEITGVHMSAYKEFPNIITESNGDVFYHRIDVEQHQNDGFVSSKETDEYVEAAKMHGAYPLVMPVSFWCTDSNGNQAVCGGSFFLKVQESRLIMSNG